MTYIDISPILSPSIAVWPGDTPLQREVLCDISSGSNIDLSTIKSTVHIGAHVDAPRHYHKDGKTIESVNLDAYLGRCYVHTVLGRALITAEDCELPISTGAKRILFRTNTFPNPYVFNEDFSAFSPDAIEAMGLAGIKLIGIDTPSVDPFHSKDLKAHQCLYKHGIANLEGILLEKTPDGHYELIALPLRLEGFDASPVRAILKPIHD